MKQLGLFPISAYFPCAARSDRSPAWICSLLAARCLLPWPRGPALMSSDGYPACRGYSWSAGEPAFMRRRGCSGTSAYMCTQAHVLIHGIKRFRRTQKAPGHDDQMLKRESHYLTIPLPVIKLSLRSCSVPTLTSCSIAVCRTRPPPFQCHIIHRASNAGCLLFRLFRFFTAQGKGRTSASCPIALFPPSSLRQPAPEQSKTRDVGTARGAVASHPHARCSSSYPNFHPPNPI